MFTQSIIGKDDKDVQAPAAQEATLLTVSALQNCSSLTQEANLLLSSHTERKTVIEVDDKDYGSVGAYPRGDSDDRLMFIYWPNEKRRGDTGHIALTIPAPAEEKRYRYVSYWPKPGEDPTLFNCCTVSGALQSQNYDGGHCKNKEIVELACLELDTEKMLERFYKLFPGGVVNQQRWSLWSCCSGYHSNCSELAKDLLESGGIRKFFPYRLRFGSAQHMALLCSFRMSVPILFLAANLYEVMNDPVNNTNLSMIRTIGIALGGIAAVSYHERKRFPRSYSEMGGTHDAIIGLFASLGYGAGVLAYIWSLNGMRQEGKGRIDNDHGINFLILDVFVLTQLYSWGGFLTFLLFGKLAKNLINIVTCRCCAGTAYTCSPHNLAAWVRHAINIRNKKDNLQAAHEWVKLMNRKEVLSLSFLVTAPFFIVSLRSFYHVSPFFGELFKGGMPATFLGLPLGFGASYSLVNCVDKPIEIADEEYNNDIRTGQFYFLTMMTLLGIASFTWMINRIEGSPSVSDSDKANTYQFLMGLMNGIGGLVGFLVGDYFYNRFQVRKTTNTQNINPNPANFGFGRSRSLSAPSRSMLSSAANSPARSSTAASMVALSASSASSSKILDDREAAEEYVLDAKRDDSVNSSVSYDDMMRLRLSIYSGGYNEVKDQAVNQPIIPKRRRGCCVLM